MTMITIIDAHPDPDPARFCHALASAYRDGARDAGHEVRVVRLADLDIPFLRRQSDWEHGEAPASLAWASDGVATAQHYVFIYPLWLGTMPALLKAFLEQVLRPGFAIAKGRNSLNAGLFKGRSARVVVTMGMPGFIYRWFYLAHSLRSFERNILRFVGIAPVRWSIIGNVAALDDGARRAWLARLADLGRSAR